MQGRETQDPGVPPRRHLPAALALALLEPHWVPRPRELTALRDAAGRAQRSGGLVAVSGEAGIGKTRLVAELAAEIHRDGALVLYGRCDSEPTVPYEPFVEALEEPHVVQVAARLSPDVRRRLALLAPGLGAEASPERRSGDEELERTQMFDALVACLRALGETCPVLLVLEDLHWWQPATLALLKYASVRLARFGVILIGTVRMPDPGFGQAVRGTLSDLQRRGSLHEVPLKGLRREEAAALVAAWSGREAPEGLIVDLEAYTGGNPFYLRSTLRQMSNEDGLVKADGTVRRRLRDAAGRLPVPDDVRDLAGALLARLDAPAAALLQIGAVLGTEFALDEAAAAAELDPGGAVAALDVVTEAGLVRQREGTPVRVTFTHTLFQQALRAGMTPSRRALVSLRAAEAIEAAGAPPGRSGELALRFAEAMTLGTASRTLRYALRAAEEAERRYAFEEQAEHLELALRAIEAGGASGKWDAYEALMGLGRARYRAAQLELSQHAFARAADLAERLEDPERVARAALGVGMERYRHGIGAPDAASIALLEQGLGAMDGRPHGLVVRLTTALAIERWLLDPLGVQQRRIDAAIGAAQELGDTEAEIEARTVRQVVLWHPTHTEELLAGVPELVSLAHQRARLDLAIHLHSTSLGQALELGRRDELTFHLSGAAEVVGRLRSPIQQVRFEALKILLALVEGRLDEARAAIGLTLPVMSEIEPETAVQLGLLWELMLARQTGSLAALRPQLEVFVAAAPQIPLARATLGEACAEAGDFGAARAQLAALAARDFEDIHEDFVWLAVLCSGARLAAAVDDRDLAHLLLSKLEPYADRCGLSGVATADPPVAYTLGLVAASVRDTDQAVAHLRAAREHARELGATPWEAQAALALGGVLRAARHRRDAREPLAEALRLAESYGGEAIALRAREELAAAGGRPSRRTDERTLTAAELRVARLAAQGRSNDHIARELFVSRRTVETHLTHAYAKLQIRSRSELSAALAAYNAPDEYGR